jgi:hypothetical protein
MSIDVWYGYESHGTDWCTELHRGTERYAADNGQAAEAWAGYLRIGLWLVFIPQAVFVSANFILSSLVDGGIVRWESLPMSIWRWIRAGVTVLVSGVSTAIYSRVAVPGNFPDSGRDMFVALLLLSLVYVVSGLLMIVANAHPTDHEPWPWSMLRLNNVWVGLALLMLPTDKAALSQPLTWAVLLLILSALCSWHVHAQLADALQLFAMVLMLVVGAARVPQALPYSNTDGGHTGMALVWLVGATLVLEILVAIGAVIQRHVSEPVTVEYRGPAGRTRRFDDSKAIEYTGTVPTYVLFGLIFVTILVLDLVIGPDDIDDSAPQTRQQWAKVLLRANATYGGSMSIRNDFRFEVQMIVSEYVPKPLPWPDQERWTVGKARNNNDYAAFHPTFDVSAITLVPTNVVWPGGIDPEKPPFTYQNFPMATFKPIDGSTTRGNENWVTYNSQCTVTWQTDPVLCPGLCVWRSGKCLDRDGNIVF